jgi:hypothetical protein
MFQQAVEAVYEDPRIGPPLVIGHQGERYAIGRAPSVKQWAFINRAEMEQLYGGSKSGGKSRAICAKLILLAYEFPGNQLGLFRQDLTDLKGSTLVTFEQTCPKEFIVQHHRTDHYFRLRTKDPRYESRIWYGGLGGNEGDFESAKGKEYGAFAVDEPSEIDLDTYLTMLGQLRWTLPDGSRPPYQAILGSNPEPGWLEDHFGHLIDAATEACPIITDGQRVYIMALPKDNPYLPPNWEQILRNQADIPKAWVEKYLAGSWKAASGMVFKELDRREHYIECPPPEFLKTLSLVGSLDHASTGITCFCIDGIDRDGNVFALGSHYVKNQLISQHAEDIRKLLDRWIIRCGKQEFAEKRAKSQMGVHWSACGLEYILIDPSTQAKTLQNKNELWSAQDMYAREGIPTMPAWNAVDVGVALMEEYIHVKPQHLHPLTGKRGSPSFFIVEAENLKGIKEMEGWKSTISLAGNKKYVGPDHWIDNQRYIIMSRPEPPRFTAKDILGMDTPARIAHRALEKFDKTFTGRPDENQWFPGGSGNQNSWFNWIS